MKLAGDTQNTTSGRPEAASQNRVELTWVVVRNGEGTRAVKMLLVFALLAVELLTWDNCLVPTWRGPALMALCHSNAFFVSPKQSYVIISVTLGLLFLQVTSHETRSRCLLPWPHPFQASTASNTTSCPNPYVHTFALSVRQRLGHLEISGIQPKTV